MNTLGEDILALQKRLLEETGLKWEMCLYAFEEGQPTTAEHAMRAGEVMTQVLGAPARIQEHMTNAWIDVESSDIKATIVCNALLGKANA